MLNNKKATLNDVENLHMPKPSIFELRKSKNYKMLVDNVSPKSMQIGSNVLSAVTTKRDAQPSYQTHHSRNVVKSNNFFSPTSNRSIKSKETHIVSNENRTS